MRSILTWISGLWIPFVGPLYAATEQHGGSVLDADAALVQSQAAIGRRVSNHQFIDQHGNKVQLRKWHGRPLVVSLIYTSCYHTCPTLTTHLARITEVAHDTLGAQSFAVLTVGFDTDTDTPDRMRIFAAERGVNRPSWTFASADAATIKALTAELGFVYRPSPKGFDHLAQTTVIDADGVITAQVYGQAFAPPLLVEPLKRLVWGRAEENSVVDGWLNNVRLICTVYDPTTGRYRFDYSIFIAAIVGLISLGSVAVFVIRAWRQSASPRT